MRQALALPSWSSDGLEMLLVQAGLSTGSKEFGRYQLTGFKQEGRRLLKLQLLRFRGLRLDDA